MPRFSITVSGELDEWLTEQVGDGERFGSKSEAVRHYLERGREADDLERELEHAEARADELREQLTARNAREKEVGELVEYVEHERAMREREQRREAAPVWKRAKWWLLGEPTESEA